MLVGAAFVGVRSPRLGLQCWAQNTLVSVPDFRPMWLTPACALALWVRSASAGKQFDISNAFMLSSRAAYRTGCSGGQAREVEPSCVLGKEVAWLFCYCAHARVTVSSTL